MTRLWRRGRERQLDPADRWMAQITTGRAGQARFREPEAAARPRLPVRRVAGRARTGRRRRAAAAFLMIMILAGGMTRLSWLVMNQPARQASPPAAIRP
jgi:hypothetical protein